MFECVLDDRGPRVSRFRPLLFGVLFLFHSSFCLAEDGTSSSAEANSSEEAVESDQPLPTPRRELQKKLAIDSSRTVEGVFYGHVLFAHPDGISVVVVPQYPNLMRRTFMLDSRTKFRVNDKKVGQNPLAHGDKVAVRYIGEPPLYLADEVFVVSGEFEPADYLKKQKTGEAKKGKAKSASH